jgi:hypothetical protein
VSASPSLDLQKAVIDALKASSGMEPWVADRIYTAAPASPVFPYVTIGPAEETSTPYECIDGFELSLQLDVWTRTMGYTDTKQIAAEIRSALHDAELVLDDFGTVLVEHEVTRFLTEKDGLTRHGVVMIRALVE